MPYERSKSSTRVADFVPQHGALRVRQDLAKLARQWQNLGNHPFLRHLGERGGVFGEALDKLDAQWGGLVVHENLLVARVTNFSLRVALEQALVWWTGSRAADQAGRRVPGDSACQTAGDRESGAESGRVFKMVDDMTAVEAAALRAVEPAGLRTSECGRRGRDLRALVCVEEHAVKHTRADKRLPGGLEAPFSSRFPMVGPREWLAYARRGAAPTLRYRRARLDWLPSNNLARGVVGYALQGSRYYYKTSRFS